MTRFEAMNPRGEIGGPITSPRIGDKGRLQEIPVPDNPRRSVGAMKSDGDEIINHDQYANEQPAPLTERRLTGIFTTALDISRGDESLFRHIVSGAAQHFPPAEIKALFPSDQPVELDQFMIDRLITLPIAQDHVPPEIPDDPLAQEVAMETLSDLAECYRNTLFHATENEAGTANDNEVVWRHIGFVHTMLQHDLRHLRRNSYDTQVRSHVKDYVIDAHDTGAPEINAFFDEVRTTVYGIQSGEFSEAQRHTFEEKFAPFAEEWSDLNPDKPFFPDNWNSEAKV